MIYESWFISLQLHKSTFTSLEQYISFATGYKLQVSSMEINHEIQHNTYRDTDSKLIHENSHYKL